MNIRKMLIASPYLLWITLFTLVPLALIVYFGFTVRVDGGVVFSTENFARFFTPGFLLPLFYAVVMAIISTAICFVIGYPFAYMLTKTSVKRKNMLRLLIVIPMWMNFLLRTYAWLAILENTGIINNILGQLGILSRLGVGHIRFLYGNGALILGMVYNFLPFMILPIFSSLDRMDKSVIEAAQDLGGNLFTVFRKVIFPLSLPGVISGVTMVFLPAVTTFVISRLLGGGRVPLIGDLIEHQFLMVGDWHFGSTMSFILMIVILFSISFLTRYEKENEGGSLL